MATNYESLENSEIRLRNMFYAYYDHVLKTQEILLQKLKNNKKITHADFDEIRDLENMSNQKEAEIMDEGLWMISKENPKANHLRFVMAILYSIKDLERMSDYVYTITQFLSTSKSVTVKIQQIFSEAFEKSYELNKIYYSLIQDASASIFYSEAQEIEKHYQEEYALIARKITDILFKAKEEYSTNAYIGLVTALKHVERTIDHAINIVENFIYIKQSTFFFEKQKK